MRRSKLSDLVPREEDGHSAFSQTIQQAQHAVLGTSGTRYTPLISRPNFDAIFFFHVLSLRGNDTG